MAIPNSPALILMYHSVTEVSMDPWSLCVTPQHFREHLEILRIYSHPTKLQKLVHCLLEGQLPARAVVMTLDDGYANNLTQAKPLLERYEVPATVFLTTGHIGVEREFWWDELERVLLQPGILPEVLRLDINGTTYKWELADAAFYAEERWRRERFWRPFTECPSSRQAIYISLWQLLRPLAENERQIVLNKLLLWANVEPKSRPTHRTLSLEEAVALASGDLLEIGSHAVTHSRLSSLSPMLQRDEIESSKGQLEEILGRPITSFAYPYGDYAAETTAIVQRAGFNCACSTVAGALTQDADLFQLPRVQVEDWDGEEFGRHLYRWLG